MGEKIVPLEMNLVRYSNPVSVKEREEKLTRKKLDGNDGLISNEKIKECDEILNCILPPREWEENGKLWRQKVSNQPATRMDVIKLTEMLDMNLQHLQARETGICPIRRALYSQCFDELIRQVTINCAERGLLLLKVRDELKMTMDAYQSLYESSIAFGIRKSLSAEHNKSDMQDRLTELEAEKQKIKDDLATAIAKYEMNQRQGTEQRIAEQQRYNEEINFLKRSNQQLKAQLEGIIAPKK
ncbi:33 kDa inner dynein arm light chain, axonemal [Sipha flava]|uniref:33 kDa inner dynein arm light chain, axonemal n=1 Tax=Sipha flava TaxID=143950 RepID=A0A8B8F4L1_9HEMI|nr:33 kDa inner dynein arm light chain, axonemal [Sipha flava]